MSLWSAFQIAPARRKGVAALVALLLFVLTVGTLVGLSAATWTRAVEIAPRLLTAAGVVQVAATYLLACVLALAPRGEASAIERGAVARRVLTAMAACVIPVAAAVIVWVCAGASSTEVAPAAWALVGSQTYAASLGVAAGIWCAQLHRALMLAAVSAAVWYGADALMALLQPHGILFDAHPNPVIWRAVPWAVAAVIIARAMTPRKAAGIAACGVVLGVAIGIRAVRPLESWWDIVPAERMEPVMASIRAGPLGPNVAFYTIAGNSAPGPDASFRIPVIVKAGTSYAWLAKRALLQELAKETMRTQVPWYLVGDAPQSARIIARDAYRAEGVMADVRVVGILPIVPGASVVWRAVRFGVVRVDQTGDRLRVRIASSDLDPLGQSWFRRRYYEFAVVDPTAERSVDLTGTTADAAQFSSVDYKAMDFDIPAEFSGAAAKIVIVRFEAPSPFHFETWREDAVEPPGTAGMESGRPGQALTPITN